MKQLIVILFSFGIVNYSQAQSPRGSNIDNIVPPTPEVAALGKNIDMPVGLATGVPIINIPIHTIKCGSINVPISLSYNASGIKVEEASTWVGLGWSLNTGASLSRVVHGLPDDISDIGFMYTTKTASYITSLPNNSPERYDLLYSKAFNGALDVEADMYLFSVGDYSGKFYFDQEAHQFITTPYQNIKIETSIDQNKTLISFKLTTPDGVQYYFGKSKDGLRTGYDTFLSEETYLNTGGVQSVPPASSNPTPGHINSWQIQDIIDPTGHQINFSYTSYASTDCGRAGETQDIAGATSCSVSGEINAAYYKQHSSKSLLNKISTNLEIVNFIPSTEDRLDASMGSKYLSKILIQDNLGQQNKVFNFGYDYFVSDGYEGLTGLAEFTEIARRRLYLKSIKQIGAGTVLREIPPYLFTYETASSLPSRFSASQDFWGYYNGQSNSTLIPRVLHSILSGGSPVGEYLPGANRTVDFNTTKAGIIKEIKYPTGGITDFVFEPNKISSNFSPSILYGYEVSGLNPAQTNFFRSDLYLLNGTNNHYRKTFTITNGNGQTKFTAAIEGCQNSNQTVGCPTSISITGITDPNFTGLISDPLSYGILPSGTYQLDAIVNPNSQYPNPDFNLLISWNENPDPNNLLIGGLRISKIISDDGNGNKLSKSFSYNSFTAPATSSGELIDMPIHAFLILCGSGSSGGNNILRRVSNSPLPLTSSDGKLVRYTNVTEYYNQTFNSFKTLYTYSSDRYNYIEPNGQNYPFPPNLQREWRSGLLLEKSTWEKLVDGTYRILQKEENNYTPFQTLYKLNYSIRLAAYPSGNNTFGVTPYSFVTEWFPLTSSIITSTNYVGTIPISLSSSKNNLYNSKFLLSDEVSKNSKGEITTNSYKYPFDFATITPYNEMINRNIINPVIEQKSFNTTLNKQLQKTTTNYSLWQNGSFILPINFQKSVYLNPLETEETIDSYDIAGNITQTTSKSGIKTSYIWGYNKQYPLARIINTTYEVAKTYINQSFLDAPTSDLNLRNHLNNLRNISGTLVTNYTYKPLVGITSETDPNNHTKYYEYDNLNRLAFIRDQDNNILKRLCYNYAGQVEDCTIIPPCTDTTANWQNTTTAVRCKTDTNGKFTGEQEQEQKDLNICSTRTYNTTHWVVVGTNPNICPIPPTCNASTCSSQGEGYACINGNCEYGFQVYTLSFYNSGNDTYYCEYHYEYSNGTWSNTYSVTNPYPCQ